MATYVIEGTISELTKKNEENDSKISIKISGSEGYAVKRDKETYNVFCPKDMPKHGKINLCYIINARTKIRVSQNYEKLLMHTSMSGKRIRLTIPEEILKSAVLEPSQDKVTSVTVLSE